ncbi:MAG TPA: SH3 domain-containing protein [Pyrinomonadaceae bacterium]
MTNGWTKEDQALYEARKSNTIAIIAVFVGIIAVFVGIIGIFIALFSPEIRTALGREMQPSVVEVKCASSPSTCEEVKPSPTKKTEPTPDIELEPTPSKSVSPTDKIAHYSSVDTRNDSGLDVREKKDILSNSVTYASEGSQVNVLYCEDENVVIDSRLGNWCRIIYEDKEGWAFGAYLGIQPNTAKRITSNDSNQRYSYIVDTRDDSGLNLRSSRDLDSDSLAFAPENREVKMIYCDEETSIVEEREGRWCKVEYDNIQGWAWGWYLDKQPR